MMKVSPVTHAHLRSWFGVEANPLARLTFRHERLRHGGAVCSARQSETFAGRWRGEGGVGASAPVQPEMLLSIVGPRPAASDSDTPSRSVRSGPSQGS